MHPNLINKKVCKQILVKNYFDDNEYIINDDISIQERMNSYRMQLSVT